MLDRKIPLALALSLLMAPAAFAQDAAPAAPEEDAPPPPGGLSMGEPLADEDRDPEVGENYVAGEFGDWLMTCVRTELEADPCQLYQLMQDDQDNSVAEISLFGLPPGGEAVAGANIVTPLGTQLTAQLTMRIDGGQAKRYPFSACWAMGCVAQVGFTADEVAALRRGNQATLIIVPAMAPDEQVPITMSLIGFTAGFNAVNEANAANQAAVEAAIAAQEAAGEDGEDEAEE